MKILDHFPLYPEKFLSSLDVQMMSIDAFGAYCKILFASWIQEMPCYIANDEEMLRKLCKVDEEKWNGIREVVMKKFKIEGIFIYNEVLLGIWKAESKDKKKKNKQELASLTSQLNYTWDEFWRDYDKKVGSTDRLIPKWIKLSNEDREKIRKHIILYKEAQPDKQFRANPEKYFNQRIWEHELIYKNKLSKKIDYQSEQRERI